MWTGGERGGFNISSKEHQDETGELGIPNVALYIIYNSINKHTNKIFSYHLLTLGLSHLQNTP